MRKIKQIDKLSEVDIRYGTLGHCRKEKSYDKDTICLPRQH